MNVTYQLLFSPCIVSCLSQEEAILSRWGLNVENEINVLNLNIKKLNGNGNNASAQRRVVNRWPAIEGDYRN